jgi:hypothetical protein
MVTVSLQLAETQGIAESAFRHGVTTEEFNRRSATKNNRLIWFRGLKTHDYLQLSLRERRGDLNDFAGPLFHRGLFPGIIPSQSPPDHSRSGEMPHFQRAVQVVLDAIDHHGLVVAGQHLGLGVLGQLTAQGRLHLQFLDARGQFE